ncbi:MAG: hypothetical protein HXS46_01480 [Theionarchaea archaeon]|nr:hypothetical protein [Theionarchaea archaeon]
MKREDRIKRFVNDQDNLDAVYWLMKGFSYREIGEKIGRSHSFVQRVNEFLENHGLAAGRQWKVDLNAISITRTFRFYDYDAECGKPKEVRKNNEFLSYFADIKKGKSGHFAIYAFPNEIHPKIGENISPYYILVPKFKAPLKKCNISQDKFEKAYEKENNENPFPPRGDAIDPDIIHIEIARYVELFGNPYQEELTDPAREKIENGGLREICLSKFVEMIEEDIKEEGLADEAEVTYDIVRNRYNDMVKKNIIYPGFGLDMRELGYVLSFCWIKRDEIYRIMKTFAEFNIVSALAYTEKDRYLLHLQYLKDKEIEIFQILNRIDHENEVFKVLKVHDNRTISHQYYFEKERKKRGIKMG